MQNKILWDAIDMASNKIKQVIMPAAIDAQAGRKMGLSHKEQARIFFNMDNTQRELLRAKVGTEGYAEYASVMRSYISEV